MFSLFSFIKKGFIHLLRILGNSLLYGVIFSTILGSIGYAAMGTGFLDWIGGPWMMVTQDGDRNTFAGVDASAFHSRMNDSWFPYPGNYQNYIRGTTNFDLGNINISNGYSLCLNGTCKAGWDNNTIPTGFVGTFNLAACPTGWIAANGTNGTPDLRGEFVRGLDNGRGVDSGRTLGSWQVDMFKSHNHNPPTEGAWVGANYLGYDGTIDASNFASSYDRTIYGTPTSSTGGIETRPRNVALLYCQKQ